MRMGPTMKSSTFADACCVYALVDPMTGGYRYIGRTWNPRQRFYQHLQARDDTRRDRWIRKLGQRSLEPVMKVLCWLTADDSKRVEVALIASLRSQGVDLTNLTEGGEGERMTEELREQKKLEWTEERRAHISRLTRLSWTLERRLANSLRHTGLKRSQETCQKISAAKAGCKLSDETRLRLSAVRKGRPKSALTRQRMSEAWTPEMRQAQAERRRAQAREAVR